MVDIQRQTRRSKSIPLVSLIDVVFQLLIYFMLTTSFTQTESLELLLPRAADTPKPAPAPAKTQADAEKTLHIYIGNNGQVYLEKQTVSETELTQTLQPIFTSSPDRGVLLLSAGRVSVQALVHVMDRIYTAGGRNMAVADWVDAPAADTPNTPNNPAEAHHG